MANVKNKELIDLGKEYSSKLHAYHEFDILTSNAMKLVKGQDDLLFKLSTSVMGIRRIMGDELLELQDKIKLAESS